MTVILVTGIMRTGTSLVSKQLHLMGVPMGTQMRFPINGQEDWEDVEFTDMMLARLTGRDVSDREEFMDRIWTYATGRRGPNTWGFKSPFALPFIEDIREAIAVEADLKVVLTTRPVTDTYESLKKHECSENMTYLQSKLLPWLDGVKFDLSIDITESWNSVSPGFRRAT